MGRLDSWRGPAGCRPHRLRPLHRGGRALVWQPWVSRKRSVTTPLGPLGAGQPAPQGSPEAASPDHPRGVEVGPVRWTDGLSESRLPLGISFPSWTVFHHSYLLEYVCETLCPTPKDPDLVHLGWGGQEINIFNSHARWTPLVYRSRLQKHWCHWWRGTVP